MKKADLEIAQSVIKHILDLNEEYSKNLKSMLNTYKNELALFGFTFISNLSFEIPGKEGNLMNVNMLGRKEDIALSIFAMMKQLTEQTK